MDEHALICPRCEREIEPGDSVDIISLADDPQGQRILSDDDTLIVHRTCEHPGDTQ